MTYRAVLTIANIPSALVYTLYLWAPTLDRACEDADSWWHRHLGNIRLPEARMTVDGIDPGTGAFTQGCLCLYPRDPEAWGRLSSELCMNNAV